MTVRWKPLLVLSALFVVMGVVGIVAIAVTMMPRGTSAILPSARAERRAKQFDRAKIHYQRALQLDAKNPALHEEMAAMYREWAAASPEEKRAELNALRLVSLAEAAKHGKSLKEPRRQLLAAAMEADEIPESVHWAKELLELDPADGDANYVVASAALDEKMPVIPEIKRQLSLMEAAKAPESRIAWIRARTAQVSGDQPGREAALAKGRAIQLAADASPIDRAALLRLRALDVETTTDPAQLADRVKSLQSEAQALINGPAVAPNRIMHLSLTLEHVQKSLSILAAKSDTLGKTTINGLVDSIENDVESIFKKSLDTASKTDLHVYLAYAEHLRFRNKRERCLKAVEEALKSPLAKLGPSNEVVLSLHAVAVEAALSDANDKSRFEIAGPHLRELVASSASRFQGLGHLFLGAIELEQSGVGAVAAKEGQPASAAPSQPKLRTSALNHLKQAAALLPDVVEAQARYGVALVLAQEPALGRQYLQNALKLGNTDPQYQIWAAWTMVQAGYPEEAEPIVNHLRNEVTAGRATRELEGTLHLLAGEILQARRSPTDLKKAQAEYDRSYAGKTPPAAVQLRMAQIDVQLGEPERALQRIEQLRSSGEGGTSAEHLAVLILLENNRKPEALERLAKARTTFPDSEELAGLEAALLIKDGKPKEADTLLTAFLEKHPDNLSIVLMRAQVLSDLLDNVPEARRALVNVADRTENSAPLVQLALLDLKKKDYDAVAITVGKIRARWKEAAAADLLDAQLALERGKLSEAATHFDAALKKDPGNKVVQFWKAQLDNRLGDRKGAAETLQAIAKDGSLKELEPGQPLYLAAQSALANLSLQNGELDKAIRQFESLRKGGNLSSLARNDRWQLTAAYAAKNQWPAARRELASLLNDEKNPPTADERVRAANLYRQNKEEAAAIAQLDYVLSVEPTHPAAVVTKAYILTDQKKPVDAAELLRKTLAVKTKDQPPAVFYLVLAALENTIPPESDAHQRALATLDQGLTARPKALELVQAKYQLLLVSVGKKDALAFLEAEAKDDKGDTLRRLLADSYRDQGEFEKAVDLLTRLVNEKKEDARLAAALVSATAQQALRAGELGQRDVERASNTKAAGLIRTYREKFPTEVLFLQEDCELAFRTGDLTRAAAITKEIDKLTKNSPVGPLLRARLYAAQGKSQDVAAAYTEALERNPAQPEVRVLLGQSLLKLNQTDEALRQARLVLENDDDRADALLLEARALADSKGTKTQQQAAAGQAAERLTAAIKLQPRFSAAYHLLAEIQIRQGQADAAITTLRRAVDQVPDDGIGTAQLVELLATPNLPSTLTAAQRQAVLKELGDRVQANDRRGNATLAIAVGYHKAQQLDAALDWAGKAASKLDAPVVHLNYGDILLTVAERTTDAAKARAYFQKAVEQYDQVLKQQANSIEAVNNKAWILHSYLGASKEALAITTDFMNHVDASTLPGEFFDTLGAIQESVGQPRDAEESYARGLRKAPDHPVLNYHMARLLATDPQRAASAREYLKKAVSSRDRLTPSMAAEVASLVEKTGLR